MREITMTIAVLLRLMPNPRRIVLGIGQSRKKPIIHTQKMLIMIWKKVPNTVTF